MLRVLWFLWVVLLVTACSSSPSQDEKEASWGNAQFKTESYQPGPGRDDMSLGELMISCERHIRTWQEAYLNQRSEENAEKIQFTELAFATLVNRERVRLESQAISGPPRNRAIAAASLGFAKDPEALPLIMNNVGDPDPMVSANALLGVAVLADASTPLGPIQDLVMDPQADPTVLSNAAFAAFRLAGRLKDDPNGGLSAIFFPLLSQDQAQLRYQSAVGLGLIRAPHAVSRLTTLLREDRENMVRQAAAWALGEIGAPGAMPSLVQALEDRDRLTAGLARAALKKIHGQDLGPDPDSWANELGLAED